MAYYQGDYYQGDYYQGDPFLGALFAKGVSWLGKKIFKRKLTEVGTTALAARTSQGLRRAAPGIAAAGFLSTGTLPIPYTPFQVTPGAAFPGGRPLFSPRQTAAPVMGAGGCCPPGFHFNKQPSMAKATMGAPAGTVCVRNRTMNVANPRALRRGLRRVAGFGKLAQRSKKDIRRAAKAIGA